MKKLIFLTLTCLSFNLFADADCTLFPAELKNKSLSNIFDPAETEAEIVSNFFIKPLNNKFKITKEIHKQVVNVTEVNNDCEIEDMNSITIIMPSENIYHVIHSTQDHCDGGNSRGIILNSNLELVGQIGDSDFFCLRK